MKEVATARLDLIYEMAMIEITPQISLADDELSFTYARSGGPGGQNVNKVSSKVTMRWHPGNSPSLPEDVKSRFLVQQGSRLTTEGELLITSQKTRDQGRNQEDCLEKLREMIARALFVPKKRKATRPSRGSIERRIQNKKHVRQRKEGRRPPRDD